MKTFVRTLALVALVIATPVWAQSAVDPGVNIPDGHFVTLCFHDVRDDVDVATDGDPYAISTERLAAFFDWMHDNDWHPVSVDDIVAAHNNGPPLPDNAVLLSFDDGLRSIYTRVYPLLEAFDYPALFALETGWLARVNASRTVDYASAQGAVPPQSGEPADDMVPAEATPNVVTYNGSTRDRSGFVTWDQVREMQQSGLAEFATHSHDLHRGIWANPQNNQEPAAITRRYDADRGRYEGDADFRQRIYEDLKRSVERIENETGQRPRAVVWPYGAMTREVIQIARSLGLYLSFGLGDEHVSAPQQLASLGRFLIMNNPEPEEIASQVERAINPPRRVQRAVQVDLDYLYDDDPEQINANLSRLLDRIKALQVRTVYLQAFADPDADGTASALYFPNRYLPMRADLFNRVAWQLKTRAGVEVYAWLPMLAFDLPDAARQRALRVKIEGDDGAPAVSPRDYRRLSPFLPESLSIVAGIYADLGKHMSGLNGILFHDDAYLGADEDASACDPAARWPGPDTAIVDCELAPRDKTLALINFGHAAVDAIRPYVNLSNDFRVARNLYARVVLEPNAEARFSQALGPFLANYDEVALMAMPYLDGTGNAPRPWLKRLARQVARTPGALERTVFELQTRDWRNDEWIEADTLKQWMRALIREGAVNLAYYPDDFIRGRPAFGPLREGMSLNEFPHRPVAP